MAPSEVGCREDSAIRADTAVNRPYTPRAGARSMTPTSETSDPSGSTSGFLGTARAERLAVLGLVLLALALRLVYVFQMRAGPHFERPIMDALYHLQWARAAAVGDDFQPGPFFRAPLYAWFLAGVMKVTGGGLLAPRIVQAALGALATGLVYFVGRRAFDRRVGFLAGLAAATYWVLLYFDGELLIATLIVPLDLLAILLTLRLADDAKLQRLGCVGLAGVAWGLSAIARPNVLLFAPFLAGWILLRLRERKAGGLRSAAVFALGVIAPILPITAYNAIVGGDFVLISSQGGVNLWIGNNPDSDGSTAIVPGTRGGWWEGYHDSVTLAETEAGHSLRPSEVSRHYARKAWAWAASAPGAVLRHLGWKVRLFCTDWELGNNQEARFFAHRFGPVVRFLPLSFAVIAGFGLLGLALSLRGGMRTFPVWGFVLVYAAGVVAFFVCSRFRVPVVPPLMILGAHAFFWLVDAARARKLGRVALGVLVVALGIAGSRTIPAEVRTSDANGYLQLGNAALGVEDFTGAAGHLRRAVTLDPRNVFARTRLARAWIALRRGDYAEEELLAALAIDPSRIDAIDFYELGRMSHADRRYEAAERWFREAEQRDPGDFNAPFALGVLLAEQHDDLRGAAGAWERAEANVDRAAPPFDQDVYDKLVAVFERLGDGARADHYRDRAH